jgi:hypothetical protein
MLAAMVETWVLWLFIVGVAIGVVATLVVAMRLPRQEDDVSALERPGEAAWISAVIERHGGIAPVSLVEEVLDLHATYLADPRLARLPATMPVMLAPAPVGQPSPEALGYTSAQMPRVPPDQAPGVPPPGYPPIPASGYPPIPAAGYPRFPAPGAATEVNGQSGPAGALGPLSAPVSADPVAGAPVPDAPAGEMLDRRA